MTTLRQLLPIPILIILLFTAVAAQKRIPVCSQRTFAALKALPKLEYECPEGNEWDNKILTLPERVTAIKSVVSELSTFTNPVWWQASTDELLACEFHGNAGALTTEEQAKWKNGEYQFTLFGNHQARLVMISDPCYQVGYSGSILFLLYHKGEQTVVSQVLDGYYSRVDNSIDIEFARLNTEQIAVVMTSNSMPPSVMLHLFTIDPKTGKAAPKKIIREGQKLTNEIYSSMLFSGPAELGLPKNAGELKIISGNRLAPSFSVYEEDDQGRIEDQGRKLRRLIYRWNGRSYSAK